MEFDGLFELSPIHRYHLAYCLQGEAQAEVQRIKMALKTKAGWFGSCNSIGHISVAEFRAEENRLILFSKVLRDFCASVTPFPISFSGTGIFNHGDLSTFYLQLSEGSIQSFVSLKEEIVRNAPFPPGVSSFNPHLTIGRDLRLNQLNIAMRLFGGKPFDIPVNCETLEIRKFNPLIGQYETVKYFQFLVDNQ